MKKILLINPAERRKATGLGAYKTTSMAPLALGYVAALTPPTYDVRIIDENVEPMDYSDVDLVGITGYTAQINRAYEIATKFCQRDIPVVIGGIHASMMPDEALKYCSAVVIGEAETTWPDLLSDFEAGCLKKKYTAKPAQLDSLPIPDRSHFKNGSYLWDAILTSKGCPMDCGFCSVTKFNGRKYRRRPVDQVIDEIKQIEKRNIIVLDDNFFGYGDKDWLYAFFNELIEQKIKKHYFCQASMRIGEDKELLKFAYKAGVRLLLLGIESICKENLASFNKKLNEKYLENDEHAELLRNIRQCGIAVLGCFIIGSDHDTEQTFTDTLNFIKKNHVDVLQLSKPTPLPGTKFYKDLDEENRIINKSYPEAWKDYKFTRMLFEPKQLSIDKVYIEFHKLKKHYYSLPQRLRRMFFTLLDTKSLTATAFATMCDHTYGRSWRDSEIYNKIEKTRSHLAPSDSCSDNV